VGELCFIIISFFKELVLIHVSQTSGVCFVAQRKLSASPVSSPPTPGTTLIKKEKKKKKKRELEEPQETEVVEGVAEVCMLCF
jgi:hypothetical protein